MQRNEEYLTLQFGSVANRICEQWWTLESINQFSREEESYEEPVMDIRTMFTDKAAKKPRLLMFDITKNADAFFFGKTDTKMRDPKNVGLWNPGKIEKHGQMEESKENDGSMPEKPYKAFEMSTKNVHLVPIFGGQFNNYLNGREFLKTSGGADHVEDSVRFFLEKVDYLGGVHSILDVNTGFGSICKFALDYIREESPKASILQVSIENSLEKQETDLVINEMRTVNKFLAMHELKSVCDAYIPVDLNVVSKSPFINPKFPDPEFHLAFLLSNLTFPYRINSSKSAFVDMKSYLNCLVPSPSNPLVNMFANVPNPSTGEGDPTDSIFEYRENLRGLFFDINLEGVKKTKLTTFGESYVLRGNLESVRYKKVNLQTPTPLCTWEHDIYLTEEITSLFNPAFKEIFGVKDELTEEWHLHRLPYHTVALNHEVFRATINRWMKEFKGVGYATLVQYIKEDFTDEELKEVRDELSSLHDNYDTR